MLCTALGFPSGCNSKITPPGKRLNSQIYIVYSSGGPKRLQKISHRHLAAPLLIFKKAKIYHRKKGEGKNTHSVPRSAKFRTILKTENLQHNARRRRNLFSAGKARIHKTPVGNFLPFFHVLSISR